jgi:hypothetical protein
MCGGGPGKFCEIRVTMCFMRAGVVVLMVLGCVNSQHAEVRLASNPAGADCFSRCVASTEGSAAVDCVAACPGAMRGDGDCGAGTLACVEQRTAATGKTTLLVIAAAVVVILIANSSGGGSDPGAGP